MPRDLSGAKLLDLPQGRVRIPTTGIAGFCPSIASAVGAAGAIALMGRHRSPI